MYCYHCGCELTDMDYCPRCGADVSRYKKIIYASNWFYNDGLSRAQVRDLSGAAASLRQSVRLYKYNIDARNLLGLIYYETGETAEALSEWVISTNLQAEKNPGKEYVDMLQNDRNRLETLSQSIRKYNKALDYASQDGLDLAAIQLKKVLQMNPHYLRARQLLALIYIATNDYAHAKRELQKCLTIDAANTTTLRYLKEAESLILPEDAENAQMEKQADKTIVKYKDGNETIIQPANGKNPRIDSAPLPTAVINIGIGLLIGAAIMGFFVLPARISRIRSDTAAQLRTVSEQSDQKTATLSEQKQQIDDLTAQNSDLQTELDKYKSTSGTLSSNDALFQAAETVIKDPTDVASIAAAFEKIDYETASTTASTQYKSLYQTMLASVRQEIMKYYYDAGYAAYQSADYVTSVTDLENAVKYGDKETDQSYAGALYYLADSYYLQYRNASSDEQSKFEGNIASAQQYFSQVSTDFPDSQFAADAETKLNEINLLKKSDTTADTTGGTTGNTTGGTADGTANNG